MKAYFSRGAVVSGMVAAIAAVGGCAGRRVDLGPGPSSNSLEGTWTATLTSAAFVATPKPLRLMLDAGANGTLLVGDEPLPPPTDPTVGSPPEAEVDSAEATGLAVHLYDGVEYSLVDVNAAPERLHFELDALQAFEPLCAIEPPISTDLGFRCLPISGGGVDRSSGSKQCYLIGSGGARLDDVDCLVMMLCSLDSLKGCRCTDASCTMWNSGDPIHARFDLILSSDGNTLDGTLRFAIANGGSDITAPGGDAVTFTREVN